MDLARKSLLLAALFILLGAVWFMDSSRAYLKTKGEFQVIHKVTVPVHKPGAGKLEVELPLAQSGPGRQVIDRRIAVSGKAPYTISSDPSSGIETAVFEAKAPLPDEFKVIVTYRVMIQDQPADRWEAGRLIFGPGADAAPASKIDGRNYPPSVSEIKAYSSS